ncbi:MAG: carboxymuconolactone decarboxylase family protein [Actinobacteria bacterium]|nr:carboxymuconolactone decarboxylase family protein [Actinomycetota bacterium]MBI3686543.1 carboxymuconolactone decarboxylase family protein [Actinomycetota bacterium]
MTDTHRSTAYERGRVLLDRELPGTADFIEQAYAPIAPDMARFVIEFGYGEVASRPGLSRRERVIANLATFIALGGAEVQIQLQCRTALALGMSREEIVEVFLNAVPTTGLARAQNALLAAREVLAPAPN